MFVLARQQFQVALRVGDAEQQLAFFTSAPSAANTSSTRPDSTASRMMEFSGSALARTITSSTNTPRATWPMRRSAPSIWRPRGIHAHKA
ncbi:hypothetical protein [Duganella sp. P38]|uniref:hypothetical protein n=1 Tax=Duganella sp. P38 TaxID=3423949 RepID=UPI003D7B9E08